MSEKCAAMTKSGRPCRAAVVYGSDFCAFHGDPGRAAELGRMGGRRNRHYYEEEAPTVTPPTTPDEIRAVLAQTIADLQMKKVEPRLASVLTSSCMAYLKATETTDHEARLRRLETKADRIDDRGETGESPMMAGSNRLIDCGPSDASEC